MQLTLFRQTRLLFICLGLLFLARIVFGYAIFGATFDENAHISRGMLWLRNGVYEADGFQMPLPRLLWAIGPHLAGYAPEGSWLYNDWTNQTAEDYWRCLTLARMGNLPFAIALLAGVAVFTRQMFGERASLAASLALVCCPNVIGHAGLATLDIGGATGVVLAVFTLWQWSLKPRLGRALLAGAACGVAQIAKFSSGGFLALPVLFVLWKSRRARLVPWTRLAGHTAVLAAVALLVIWAGYGFEIGEVHSHRHSIAIDQDKTVIAAANWLEGMRLPAPRFWTGFVDMAYLQKDGFPAFLMGEIRTSGWWRYFPTVLLLKATPPLLVLSVIGFACRWSRGGPNRDTVVFLSVTALWIVAVSIPSSINIGVRHILAIFPILCVLCGAVFAQTPSRPFRLKAVACALLAWHAVESFAAHPDYLAYFGPAFRRHDYYLLSDSNLDWGQDRARLAEWVTNNQDEDVHALAMATGDIANLYKAPTGSMESEWILLTTNQWVQIEFKGLYPDEVREMFRKEPWGRIGRSVLIFHFPERSRSSRQ